MFQEFLEKHKITDKTIAVGVSGGADSLGLLLMAFDELTPLGHEIVALTVDHGLRPSSSDEAMYVKKIAEKYGIKHHILVWEGKKPQTGIEEAARVARYALINDWCIQNNVHCVMMAHHLQDQAETFLMRLYRGSGLNGLCGMQEVCSMGNMLILRPLLMISPDVMKTYLKQKHIAWVEDETNCDETLLRVKMRNFLKVMEKNAGITPLMIAQTMFRLQSSKDYIETQIDQIIKNHMQYFGPHVAFCRYDVISCSETEVLYRIIAALVQQIGQLAYRPESQKVLALLEKIKNRDFKSATLGHCQIILQTGYLWFTQERRESRRYTKKDWENYAQKHMPGFKCKIPAAVKKTLLFC
ncbi:MAG: tRNA lysidine(34) synthetase TilS [Alphaproteobacteria bacterium]|nr:tRNA lysidine(34) synthetase TilS [Alphaproteobacteria bacterium]